MLSLVGDFTSWQHVYSLLCYILPICNVTSPWVSTWTVRTHHDFIVLPHWDTRPWTAIAQFPTQSSYPDAELHSPGNAECWVKYQLCKSLVLLDWECTSRSSPLDIGRGGRIDRAQSSHVVDREFCFWSSQINDL